MNTVAKRKVTASFMIGYLISYLKYELSESESSTGEVSRKILTIMSRRILATLADLFQEVFDESISGKLSMISTDELKYTLTEIFDLISEKIQRGGESFLEISFLFGGLLSLTETEEPIFVNRKKMEAIIHNLIGTLELNFCCYDLNKIINELTSKNILLRRNSRDLLFSLISGNQNSQKKIFHETEFVLRILQAKKTSSIYASA